MTKTGSSSIQESLYFGLSDSSFRYVSLGSVNAVMFLESLFSDHAEDFWEFRAKGISVERIEKLRQSNTLRLRRTLRKAREQSQTPIISAERLWSAPSTYLERLRDFLREEGFEARIVVYVRPIRSWVDSHFQTLVRWRLGAFDRLPCLGPKYLSQWSGRLELFECIFGSANLSIRLFHRSALVAGCVVLDFCHTIGAAFEPLAVVRCNDSLSLDAVRFLFAYNRYIPARVQPSFLVRMLLTKHLESLKGERLRLHPHIFSAMEEAIEAEHQLIFDRYGIDLGLEDRDCDQGSSVRDESDLLCFSSASLEWLAKHSRSQPVQESGGEEASRQVAAQLERIRRHPSWRKGAELLHAKIRMERRSLLRGD